MKHILLACLLLALTVSAAAQTQPECKVRVMVVKHDWEDAAKLKRHTFSKHQAEWWKKNRERFPGVCLVAAEPADYLLTWTETWTSVPYVAPVTATHSGSVRTDSGDKATYEGTSTTYQTREWHHWWVEANLFKLESGKPLPVFKAEHHGRWRWSKPDKDAFEKALKRVRDMAKPIDRP